jgi:hypothetical protein
MTVSLGCDCRKRLFALRAFKIDQIGHILLNKFYPLLNDLVVMKKGHRDAAEKIWKLPAGTIPPKPGFHAVLQNRMLKQYYGKCRPATGYP